METADERGTGCTGGECDWKKGFYHGVKGYTVTGPNGSTIFLLGVGGRIQDKTIGVKSIIMRGAFL